MVEVHFFVFNLELFELPGILDKLAENASLKLELAVASSRKTASRHHFIVRYSSCDDANLSNYGD